MLYDLDSYLSINELNALVILVHKCLQRKRVERPIQLPVMNLVCSSKQLKSVGWKHHAAAGTISSLTAKGFICKKDNIIYLCNIWSDLEVVWDKYKYFDKHFPYGEQLKTMC